MKLIRWIFGISLFSYTAAGVALFFMQGQMIYLPDERDLDDCTLPPNVAFWDHNGERGLLNEADNTNILIFFHGNADMACDWRYLGANHINALGYDVLVVEYPGYGGDTRSPGKTQIEAAIDASHDWVAAQGYAEIALMGHSLGTGAASIYAERYGADQVILFAPFDSIYNVARGQGMAYPRFLLTEDFDNAVSLADVNAPIAILHGAADQVIPASHSANLERELRASGHIVTRTVLEGVGHNGLFATPFFDQFIAEIINP